MDDDIDKTKNDETEKHEDTSTTRTQDVWLDNVVGANVTWRRK